MVDQKHDALDLSQVAAVLGVSSRVVRSLLEDAGVTPHDPTGDHWRTEEVRALSASPTAALRAARGRASLLSLPAVAAELGVHREVVRDVLRDAGFRSHDPTGSHWRADDIASLCANPTPLLVEARTTAISSPDPAAANAPRIRKRPKNVVPDPSAPERLDLTEAASVLGAYGTVRDRLLEMLDDAGFSVAEGDTLTWDADAVHHLAKHPTALLNTLRNTGEPMPVLCRPLNAARLLGIGTRRVTRVMRDAGYEELRPGGYWDRDDVVELAAVATGALLTARQAVDHPGAGPVAEGDTAQIVPDDDHQNTRDLAQDPLRLIVAHLGPTNSGKTYEALRRLVARSGAGSSDLLVYAAPLRMMAQEAYETLTAELDAGRVGLMTGEERRNVEARVLCVTTELAPMRGDLLVLDEVQWCADPQRGAAWTQRVLDAEYIEMRLVGSPDALPVLREILGQRLEVEQHRRLVSLEFIGSMDIDDVLRDRGRTIIIAFQRKAVLAIAGAIQRRSPASRIAVLYGAMPLNARRHQIRRVRDGDVDVIVASDVLGHGVNLPCDRILFAESKKYDGVTRRRLHNYEVAQIAGRAGRYGLSEAGEVGVLAGLDFVAPDERTIRRGLDTPERIEDFAAHRRIEAMVQGPQQPNDLGCELAADLPNALRRWYARAKRRPRPGIEFENPRALLSRLTFVDETLRRSGSGLHALTITDAWKLARSRLTPAPTRDADRVVLTEIAHALAEDRTMDTPSVMSYQRIETLEQLEYAAQYLDGLLWCAMAFPERRLDPQALVACESAIADQFAGLLIDLKPYAEGRCERCARPCSPLLRCCVACHADA